MFPYRGLVVLIALCVFGAIQASYEAGDEFKSFKHGPHHGHHNSSNSSGHGPSGNHSHPHHPGHNSSHPSGNVTHPHHPGHSNSSHPSGNYSHPYHPHNPGHSNSSHWKVAKEHKSRYQLKPHMVFRPIRSVLPDENRLVPAEQVPQPRGLFNWRPFNKSRPVYKPYRPIYKPVRPAVNGSWYRPGNNSWSNWG